MSHDVIVIGAGTNGLAAAHLLARAGRKVLVLERQAQAAAGLDKGWVPPALVRELGLDRHGLRIHAADPWLTVALPDGGRLELSRDVARSAEAIRRLSARDAERWPEFCARMRRLAGFLETLYLAPPPAVDARGARDLLQLAGMGWRARGLGKRGMIDLLRVLPMPVAELLDDWFESDALKAALGAAGILHLRQGPRSGGTAFNFLHHHVGSPAGVFRPSLSNAGAVLAALPGVELRRGAAVTRINVRAGKVAGVVVSDREELTASLVVSSADPRATLLGLTDPGWLDPELVRAVRNIKCRGVTAQVSLTLDRPAGFDTLSLGRSLEHLERAYDDVKYGRVSRDPYLEARAVDSRIDVHVQFAPYALAEGAWDEARRSALGDLVVERLTAAEPGLAVKGRDVLTPSDLESRYGVTEGHLYHGELTLDQILFMRPVPACSRYRTPIEGLYLCGAGSHPGGAMVGAAGRNAAREILRGVA